MKREAGAAAGAADAAHGKRRAAVPGNASWRDMLERIREMRKERNAAVDLHGCEVLSDPLADKVSSVLRAATVTRC